MDRFILVHKTDDYTQYMQLYIIEFVNKNN